MDMNLDESWVLNYMEEKDEQLYAYPQRIENPPKSVIQTVSSKGAVTDFSLNLRSTIIGTGKLASLFSENEVQLIPVRFKEFKTEEPFYALVVLNELECIDEEESVYEIWKEGNLIRPDLAGRIKAFFKLRIRKDFKTELNIFRIKRYKLAIVVSEDFKKKAMLFGLTGMNFIPLK